MTTLYLGTRKSALALWQANHVRERLLACHRDLTITLVPMTTEGDRRLGGPLVETGGKALFTKELEQGLLERRIDLAVHSMKDVVAELPAGLVIAAILEREDPRDALIAGPGATLAALPAGLRVGTESLRRRAQIQAVRPDLQLAGLRGNVNSRLARFDRGEYGALILAAAGLKRLGFTDRISSYLEPDISLPAAAQGAIGIECRAHDDATQAYVTALHHPDTAVCVQAERIVNAVLAGGCRLPIGAFATLEGPDIRIRGLVGEPDGRHLLRAERRGERGAAASLARAVAEDLLHQGAGRIIDALRNSAP
ncbi:MAG: hydroxymethylbilane synthase [Gammaproteobacteria bacterium]|nr:hydroxymethylbilane synthase [Gammaproteobacteria bacterium]